MNYSKAPFPWAGGKSKAAAEIWAALGDVEHYVEPFAGSLAALLGRPHLANRTYHSETVNDADGLLVNAWRSIQLSPELTAEAASNPVAEADLHARHLALVRWREGRELEHLMGDPLFHDPVMGGWWLWGQSSWIGSGWCSGKGPWIVGEDDRMVKRAKPNEEPGVHRQRPHLGNNGQGVNHPGTREPGVSRQLPVLSGDGQGVNHPGTREPGVHRKRPHLGNSGRGVNHAGTREPDVGYHDVTMPQLLAWFHFLAARLRHVRVLNGDWARATTGGAVRTLTVRQGGTAGIFLDPPYADTADRMSDLYAVDSESVAHDVAEWCEENGARSDYRIVLAGFEGEHGDRLTRLGWAEIEWFKGGFLTGGMGNTSKTGSHQQNRERLWLSPACLVQQQAGLFD